MAGYDWIFGTSVNSKEFDTLKECDKFLGYLVHLDAPRCIIAVGQYGFLQDAEIDMTPATGFYYKSVDKDIELVIIEWLEQLQITKGNINALLREAAVHLEIHLQYELENADSARR